MPTLATWIRLKDEKWFRPLFARYPAIEIRNACGASSDFDIEEIDALLLTGGGDVGAKFLRQPITDPGVIQQVDSARDEWEFAALAHAIARGKPVLAICRGMQLLNVALGGTLKLDIPGHRLPEQKDRDIQPLRTDRRARHRFQRVNSSHHQALDRLADRLRVEAWCTEDAIVEQVRLRDYPFAVGVQYHPERGTIYGALFDEFFSRIIAAA